MGLAAAGCVLAAPGVSAAGAADLFYERTVMAAADQRCGLFEPAVSAALAAGRMQAQGAALRAGASKAVLASVERRATAKAASTPCASADLAVAASRVRSAYEAYAQLSRMSYPGEISEWRADRTGSTAMRWRLQQSASFGADRMIFGLAGRDGAANLLAIAVFRDGRAPFAARLVLRDADTTLGPHLDMRGQSISTLPLSRRLPPASGQIVYSAEARSTAGADLLPAGSKSGWAFRFPNEAAKALAELDPREAVAVEFLFSGPGRDTIRRAYVEVGDFAAGRAFLQVAAR
ncbi:hypothetical protein [Phenylobacterium koreense]|uniref:SCP domain-containing protein n=1 Tax=Phenylobacterium koreense TaxID=266125 RepID=A0ABV2EFQ3_9CAUL